MSDLGFSGNIASSAISAGNANQINEANRRYGAFMSSTAYSRAVNDMKRAGLNPMAMFGGGKGSPASTPAGSSVKPDIKVGIPGGLLGSAQSISNIKNTSASNEVIKAQADRSRSEALMASQDAKTNYYYNTAVQDFYKNNPGLSSAVALDKYTNGGVAGASSALASYVRDFIKSQSDAVVQEKINHRSGEYTKTVKKGGR